MSKFEFMVAAHIQNLKPSRWKQISWIVFFCTALAAMYSVAYIEFNRKMLEEDDKIFYRGPVRSPQRKFKNLWIETISVDPRIFIIHNLISAEECEHLVNLAQGKGLKPALITPYGTHTLVESTTRTNKQAWLDFGQDSIVSKIEHKLADITGTRPGHGESLQVLHYNHSQQFMQHHDYFDPATDPPENFKKGGNRLATAVIYLREAEEGGETHFLQLGLKLTARRGDAILFYNLHPRCDGTRPACVDKRTEHAGLPPTRGDKWVATKWIHEREYQAAPDPEDDPAGSGGGGSGGGGGGGAVGGCVDRHPRCAEWAEVASP